jgi:hypothetical protein
MSNNCEFVLHVCCIGDRDTAGRDTPTEEPQHHSKQTEEDCFACVCWVLLMSSVQVGGGGTEGSPLFGPNVYLM